MRILLIDDNPIDLLVHTRVLENNLEGYEIVQMLSAIEALAYLRKETTALPDLILLDIKMPLMDGFEFLEVLKTELQPVVDQAEIYVVSSSIDPKDIGRVVSDPTLSGFVMKPLHTDEVRKLWPEICRKL